MKNTKGAKKLEHISEFCFRELDKYEAVIVGEMKEERCLIGINNSLLTTNMLFRINPNIKVGVFAGNVNAEALRKKKIVCIPKKLAPPKYCSYQFYHLGTLPVIELYAAGLKVGQEMAFARKQGWSTRKSVEHAMANSAAMDFQGELSWI